MQAADSSALTAEVSRSNRRRTRMNANAESDASRGLVEKAHPLGVGVTIPETGSLGSSHRLVKGGILRFVKPGMREVFACLVWFATGGAPAIGDTAGTALPADRIGPAWRDARNPIARIFHGERLDLWSLRAPHATPPPHVDSQHGMTLSAVDWFLVARLTPKHLTFSSEADRRTLIRRVTFDLTGLPPTPDEVDRFLQDPSRDAYDRLVTRLLESPRYGENQARLWLDVVRYSDSNGFDWDEFRPKAWRFRDYVVRAFNMDKPFDRFVLEQLAGDELVPGAPRTPEEQDSLIATGFLRLGPHDSAAPLFNEQERSRAELMSDLVETTGGAFLGLTMACCRCHDHKFDPLSQADHYRMRAFFEPVKFANDTPLDLDADQTTIRSQQEAADGRLLPLEKTRDQVLNRTRKRLRGERIAKLSTEEHALLAHDATNAPPALTELQKRVMPSDPEVRTALPPEDITQVRELETQIATLKRERPRFTTGLLMTDAEGPPPATRVLHQGRHQDPRDPVEPGFPSALDPQPARIDSAPNPKTQGRRLALARWIVSPENPLTARVFVNRIWQQHFGTGLVVTPNDFGFAGTRPSHPELLDWLAVEFMNQGWSVKHLHRLLVTSVAYRQGSAGNAGISVDPDNLWLWRQNPHRLAAEPLRDALLASSGLLLQRAGGTPTWPELPPEVLQANPAFLDDNETKTKGWYPSPAADQPVRSLFLVQKRTVRVPFMETFDLPENSTSCARRTSSTVAPQALSLMNGSVAVEAARTLADRVRREVGEKPELQIRHAFRLTLLRAATPVEIERSASLMRLHGLTALCRALLNLNEFAYVD